MVARALSEEMCFMHNLCVTLLKPVGEMCERMVRGNWNRKFCCSLHAVAQAAGKGQWARGTSEKSEESTKKSSGHVRMVTFVNSPNSANALHKCRRTKCSASVLDLFKRSKFLLSACQCLPQSLALTLPALAERPWFRHRPPRRSCREAAFARSAVLTEPSACAIHTIPGRDHFAMVLLRRASHRAAAAAAAGAAGTWCATRFFGVTPPAPEAQAPGAEGQRVPLEDVHRFVRECMEKAGAPTDHAKCMADLLAEADRRGHYSHGINRLEMYVNDLEHGTCDGAVKPKILKEAPAVAWVDGRNGLGPVVASYCMDLAIRKAKEVGAAFVAVKGSNHFGIAGWYSRMAIDEGMIGIAMTNTSPLLCPTRSKDSALGTNPIAIGAPAVDDSFELDMATTAVAVGKIEIKRRAGAPLPVGWANDVDGQPLTDADEAMKTMRLLPLGGTETHSGFKGYGLALAVDVLGAVLAGGTSGPDVRKWLGGETRPADLGHTFIAVDLRHFTPDFRERLQRLLNQLRCLPRTNEDEPVLVAGDKERAHTEIVEREGGVNYIENQLKASDALAMRLGVQPMKRNPFKS